MFLYARSVNVTFGPKLIAAMSLIAAMILPVSVSHAIPVNSIIEFDDFLIPGIVNWTGSYTVDSNTGLLTRFEATICRAADQLNECVFNNLFNVSLPAVDDPDDNDNLVTNVLTPTNSAVLLLRDGLTNEWQITDPFGSLSQGVYTTRRVPEPPSFLFYLLGILLLAFPQWRPWGRFTGR